MKEHSNIEFIVVPSKAKKKPFVIILCTIVGLLVLTCVGILIYNSFFRVPERNRTFYINREIVSEDCLRFFDEVYWIKPSDSKLIKATGYDPKQNVLFVCYRGKEFFELYISVPQKEWNNLIGADFFDKYFEKNIKESFVHRATDLRCKLKAWE